MIEDQLSLEERSILLDQARKALISGVKGIPLDPLHLEDFPPNLRRDGVAFVTLTMGGHLRGCVGALEAYQPLIEDVREHAIAAALKDYRFPVVQPTELSEISIEISRLTPSKLLDYDGPDDLLKKLRPGIDGVVLKRWVAKGYFFAASLGETALNSYISRTSLSEDGGPNRCMASPETRSTGLPG